MMDKGILYLVATPIGNLEDITLRALRILREVDIIAAEDTRQTLKLLNHFEIKKTLVSYYEHNKDEKGRYLIQRLNSGESVALVSDAGTPGISDPGEDLVRLAYENGITVTMAPGPAAAIMGLVLSGLPTGRFVFEGFLPMNKRARKEKISEFLSETRTVILYEAPHKLLYTLQDLREILGDRRITLARELTKKFEEINRTTLDEALSVYNEKPPRGEYVVILEGVSETKLKDEARAEWSKMTLQQHLDIYLKNGLDKKEAIKRIASDRGMNRRDVYSELIEKK